MISYHLKSTDWLGSLLIHNGKEPWVASFVRASVGVRRVSLRRMRETEGGREERRENVGWE